MSKEELIAPLLLRVLALLIMLLGIWMLLCNLIESIAEFNPAYLYYYFENQLLRPLMAIAIALLLYKFSLPLARILLRGIEK